MHDAPLRTPVIYLLLAPLSRTETFIAQEVAFLAERGVDFPILLDSKNQVSKLYDVVAMPTTVVVDRDGNMRFLHQGYKAGDENEYRKMVKKLVRE